MPGPQRGGKKHKQNKTGRPYHQCRKKNAKDNGGTGIKQWPDQIHKSLKEITNPNASEEEKKKFEPGSKQLKKDEDLPGEGQFYCVCCDKYFIDIKTREVHFKSKGHKKTLKSMMKEQHTQKDAEELGKF